MKASATGGRDPYAGGHGTSSIHVEHYDLDLTYRIIPNRLRGTATLTLVTTEAVSEIVLDLVGLTVDKVTLTGGVLRRHVHRAGRLTLRLADEVAASTRLTVTVQYGGNPKPVPSPWGPVGWEELEEGVLVASQPTGAPSWFPCNDRPDDKATYRTTLTVDNPYHVLAHGTLVSTRARASATTWVYEERHPTSPYLATVQIGQYTEIVLAEEPVPQRALVPVRLTAPTRRRLEQHGELMSFFASAFGPYPFETYTVVCTPDELEIPLEAQGISIFGANHLSAPEVEERLIAHELAHQWFGNSVSVTSWRHVWLNEGFACYAEWLWSEESGGDTTEAMARMWHTRLKDLPQDLVLADPGYAQIFDDRIYKRGALTLHALRHALGPTAFRGLVREWASVFAHSSASTEDLRSLAERHSLAAGGADLAQAVTDVLDAWLDRPELPPFPGGSDEP